MRAIFQVQAPGGGEGGLIFGGAIKRKVFLRHRFRVYLEGLIHGGVYFRNSTVLQPKSKRIRAQVLESKPVHFGLLNDGFMILPKKLLETSSISNVNNNSFSGLLIVGSFKKRPPGPRMTTQVFPENFKKK